MNKKLRYLVHCKLKLPENIVRSRVPIDNSSLGYAEEYRHPVFHYLEIRKSRNIVNLILITNNTSISKVIYIQSINFSDFVSFRIAFHKIEIIKNCWVNFF